MASPSRSVSGFQKPGILAPRPAKGLSAVEISHSGMTTSATSIIVAWNTSVRETATKPPMNVYDATASRVARTPTVCGRSKAVFSSLAPAMRPEAM